MFFRFLKHVLGLRSLRSTKDNGVMIQVWCAVIAALLMSLACGRELGRGEVNAFELFIGGWAEEDELLGMLEEEAAKRAAKKR